MADGWYGMWLPAGSSPEFAKKLSTAVAEVLAKSEVKEKLLAVCLIPVGSTPGAVGAKDSRPITPSGSRS